ncbi:FxsA family protein [Jeongeupia naejangsanensis]|uniref:FxsA family protein n=1 Tax=Jeongeupia naejangsanensis TaxID=613195 RepID=A0ABS2BM22_9NEIS|nr:FxsA family protein [Jeongeupia naejangsanensis]MBM3116667.1 FxsA family protein [Jeongeupia naejangsanensis]
MPYLFLAFIVYPLAEIASMVVMADWIGAGWVFLALLASALIGIGMLRHHRIAVAWSLVNDLKSGRLTPQSLFWVARYYIAAILFIVPGFIGDIAAVVMLLPWGRRGDAKVPPMSSDTLEGEYRRVDPRNDAQRRLDER